MSMQSRKPASGESDRRHSPQRTPDAESNQALPDWSEEFPSPNLAGLPAGQRQQAVQAILNMQRTHGNAYVMRMLARDQAPARETVSPKTAGDGMIQRYQAGEQGHGGIEQRALTSVGFSEEEAGQIYFGNWLRDFSQLNGSGSPLSQPDFLSLFTVIQVLGWGEYNREVKPDELGTYVPSEHLDNPSAGGLQVDPDKRTVEDPEIQALSRFPEGDPRRKPFDDAFAKLSPDQQAAYRSEEARRAEITEASRKSGLPEYIERGKMHAKDKLKTAIEKGRNPTGFQQMGDALHAVEDYFSHSNFVDVAIWTLHNEGVTAAAPYVKSMVEHMHGTNPALVGGTGANGQPQILTGTYSPGHNDWVSRIELLKAQLHSGEFAKAFIIGLIRMGKVKIGDIAEALGGSVGSTAGGGVGYAVGGVAGGVTGLVEGAGEGASRGYDEGSRSGYEAGYELGGGGDLGEKLGAVGSFFGGVSEGVKGFFGGGAEGAVRGATEGSESGERTGSAMGGTLGSAAGRGMVDAAGTLMLGTAELDMLMAGPLIQAQMSIYMGIIDMILDHLSEREAEQSGVQAAERGLTGPTHSQIAKDAPDHPLFTVSVRLAEEVDRQIGLAMQAAWAARASSGAGSAGAGGAGAAASASPVTDEEAQPVTSLVDKYVSQPSADPWWRPILTAALSEGGH